MAALVALLTNKWRRRAFNKHGGVLRTSSVKRMPELENNLMKFMLPFSLANLAQDRKIRSRDEIRRKETRNGGRTAFKTGRAAVQEKTSS